MTTLDPQATIDELLGCLGSLGSLPDVTRDVIAVVDAPDSTADELNRVVDRDPFICAHLVKVANTPFYGMSSRVSTVRRAIDLLGFQATRNVAVLIAMGPLRRAACGVPGFGAPEWWSHALAAGVAARGLARAIGERLAEDEDGSGAASPDEVYLAALLHDLGQLVFMVADPARFTRLARTLLRGGDRDDAELEVFGVTHAALGEALCRRWKLPRVLQRGVRDHHHPEAHVVAGLLHAAHAFAGEPGPGPDDPSPARFLAELGLEDRDLATIRGGVAQQLEANTPSTDD